jgi:O-acetyl-ADP-ribose deacetylase (regulator of RNase III)
MGENPTALSSCYRTSLNMAAEMNVRTIVCITNVSIITIPFICQAFPCISTGVYGYPNEKACNVALSTIQTWLESNHKMVGCKRIYQIKHFAG